MRSARPAGELPLHDDRVAAVGVKTQIRSRGAKQRHRRDPARNRNVHRPAIVGYKHATAADRGGQFAQTYFSDQIDGDAATLSLHVINYGGVIRAAEQQNLTTPLA